MGNTSLERARVLTAVTVLALLLAAACGRKAQQRVSVAPPVQNLSATLDDEIHELSGEKIKWSTSWRLCWADYKGVSEYQLQALTSEGASDKLRRQSERCFRVEVAAGENPKTQGLLNRDLQVAMRSSELAYRVRAVLGDGQFSEWSKPLSVGETTDNDAQ